MSCKNNGLRKAAEKEAASLYKKLHGRQEVRPPDEPLLHALTCLVLLYQGKPLERIAEITGYAEAPALVAGIRRTKLFHRGVLDVTEWMRKNGLMAFVLDAMAVLGADIDGGVKCPHCERGWCNRAGRDPNGRQRWRCKSCGRSTGFPGGEPEDRLRVPLLKRREIVRLARKKYQPADIARRVEVSVPTVMKIVRLWESGKDLTGYAGDLYLTHEGTEIKGAATWEPKRERLRDPHKLRHYQAVRRSP